MTLPYLIVWDLDGTLGDFSALERRQDPTAAVELLIRPGLAEALRELTHAGFQHTVLTMAFPAYAEIVLRGAGLRHVFARVEGRGQRNKGDAAGVAAEFGLKGDQLAERVLFVGDRLVFDEPNDPNVVFHFEPCALARPASKLTKLVLHLQDVGAGSIRAGFQRLNCPPRRWFEFARRSVSPRLDEPMERELPGLGTVVSLLREKECPILAFAEPPPDEVKPTTHRIMPDQVLTEIQAASRAQ